MLCFESNPRIARHVIYSPRGYLIPRLDGRLIAGSTTEYVGFEKHVTASGLNTITANALEIAPVVGELKVSDSWAGLRPKSIDDLPVLGACAGAPGLYFATGHYRNGILLAPITGELIAEEVITGVTPEQARPFSPDRFNFAHV
jgi:glycine oxidase